MEMKQCSKCKEWKELSEFYKNKNHGHRNDCKKCHNENSKKYYEKNSKEIKKRIEKYYENNPEKRKEINKRWRKNNPEKVIENNKKWQENNPEKRKEINKRWKENNPEYMKEYNKKWCKDNFEYLKEYRKEWFENNPEYMKEYRKEYNNSYVLWNSSFPEQIKLYENVRQNDIYLEVKCAYCGRWFKPTNSEIRNRLNAINGTQLGESRFYCSDKCKKECPIYNQKKWPKGQKPATSREIQAELRQMVLARDNYTCQKCEKTQDDLNTGLHCHHIEGITQNPIESADIDNCITLCKQCHKEVHKLPGCGYLDLKC